MSGRLFSVFNKSRWSQVQQACPEEMEDLTVTLTSLEGDAMELEGQAACLSGMIRNSISLNGTDSEIETHLKKTTLTRVIEYLNYHKDLPPSEIEVPLVSDNLAECGVSKFDVAFINVDKESLFEVLMAANALDIPSLAFLATIKAFLLFKGKTADKIRKEAGMNNDLPEDEETDLIESYNWANSDLDPEEANLASLAAIMQGMAKAADGSGLFYTSGMATEPSVPSTDFLSFRSWVWTAAVANDWKLLEKAPDEVRGNKDLMIQAARQSHGAALAYATDGLKADRDFILAAVNYGGDLSEAAFELRSNREFVLEATMLKGDALKGASDSIRGNKDLILSAVGKGRASVLKGASGHLTSDSNFMLQCIALGAEAYRYADPKLHTSRKFALDAINKNAMSLQYMSQNFKVDREIVAKAVAKDPEAAPFAHTAARADVGVAAPHDPKAIKPAGFGSDASLTGPRQVGLSQTHTAIQQGMNFVRVKTQKSVQFSALSSMFANMGQGNYIAANMMLDKFPFVQRPEIDAVTVMWGAVGAIGMRWKAFASQDFLNATPDILMNVDDCCKILHMLTTRMDTPEWTSASLNVTPEMMGTTAGIIGGTPGGGWRGGESAGVSVQPLRRKIQRQEKGTEPEQPTEQQVPMDQGPLGGWLRLPGEDKLVPTVLPKEFSYSASELRLVEGAHVKLTGLQAKNGMTGVVHQHFPDSKGGKWKVVLDHDRGSAQLKECYLDVIAPPDADWREKAKAAAAELKAARIARKASVLHAAMEASH